MIAAWRQLVTEALREDMPAGDITSESCVPPEARAHAELRSRQPLIVAGMSMFTETFRQLEPPAEVHAAVLDGVAVEAGRVLATVSGSARTLLAGERVALNFLQRLSGVATLTRNYVDQLAPGSRTRIADTRKTTPGWRSLERHAVRCGGGVNHRNDLSSAVLIKDNHIAVAGNVTTAVSQARARAPHTSRIACEVDSLGQLAEALALGVDIVLLDNFCDEQVRQAMQMVAGRALVEVSGGLSLERVLPLSSLGVDILSVGALTHSAPSVDLGLDFVA